MKIYPKVRLSNILVQTFENEILIYDLQINKAFCLNETSALVWQLCTGENTVTDIREKLGRKLKTNVPEDLVWLTLDGLKKTNLLETNASFKTKFDGLNRREIIKKVGLASMVTLPLISSLIAPTVAMAQSGVCGLVGQSCSPPNPFTSGVGTCCAGTGYCGAGNKCVACLPSGSVYEDIACVAYRCCDGTVFGTPAGDGINQSCIC